MKQGITDGSIDYFIKNFSPDLLTKTMKRIEGVVFPIAFSRSLRISRVLASDG